MLGIFNQKKPKLVGIDISSSTIKLLELGQTAQGYIVESYAVEAMPPNAMDETEIKDIELVGEAVARVVKRARSSVKHGAIAVHGSSVITKTIQMNAGLSEHEMANQIAVEADRYIPFPLEEVNLDFQVIGQHDKNPDLVDVLLVASRSENVDNRAEVLTLGGLQPQVVDIEAYAIERAFGLIAEQLPEQGRNQTVAVVDIGSTMTTLSVLHDRMTIYTREQLFGGKQLTDEIQRRYGLSAEEAGIAKKEGGLPDDYETQILEPFKEAVVQQVSRSLQFFFSSSEMNEIDYLILGGGTACISGLSPLIEQKLGVPTIIANPFSRMSIAPKVSVPAINADAPSLLICCGLALRSFV